MLAVLWPTLVAALVAVACAAIRVTQPRLQTNTALRVALIVSTVVAVGLALVAGVEIISRVLAFGLEDAF